MLTDRDMAIMRGVIDGIAGGNGAAPKHTAARVEIVSVDVREVLDAMLAMEESRKDEMGSTVSAILSLEESRKEEFKPVTDALLSLEEHRRADLAAAQERLERFVGAAFALKGEPLDLAPLVEAVKKQGDAVKEVAESNKALMQGFSALLAAFAELQKQVAKPREKISLEIVHGDTKSHVTEK